MNSTTLVEHKEGAIQKEAFSFNWKNSPSIQHLLDTISSILTDEYITISKQNPTVFTKQGGPK